MAIRTYSQYPAAADLQAYLSSCNVVGNQAAFDKLRLDDKVAAAADEFEQRTSWSPYLAAGDDSTRYFNPPRGTKILSLEPSGLVSFTSLTINDVAFTEGYDFWLEEANAPQWGDPYTEIRFRFPVTHTLPQRVAVTGVWGKCLALPAADWDAILKYAAFLCYPEVALSINRGLYSVQDVQFELRYAGSNITSLSRESEAWKATFDAVVKRRQRVRV